jgi:HSP20 family protein
VTQELFGTPARPQAIPTYAFRRGDEFVVQLDLPGLLPNAIDLTVERKVLAVHAHREHETGDDIELLIGER